MLGRRTLVEIAHMVIGVAGAAVLAYGAVWSLPHAHATIWAVAYCVMAAAIAMSIPPLLHAWRADRNG